eukprot:364513-Chlamydomonas_euryale.AAC.13
MLVAGGTMGACHKHGRCARLCWMGLLEWIPGYASAGWDCWNGHMGLHLLDGTVGMDTWVCICWMGLLKWTPGFASAGWDCWNGYLGAFLSAWKCEHRHAPGVESIHAWRRSH